MIEAARRDSAAIDEGLERPVRRYAENSTWWSDLLETKSDGGRLGLRARALEGASS